MESDVIKRSKRREKKALAGEVKGQRERDRGEEIG